MRISDWSSDGCSSDLSAAPEGRSRRHLDTRSAATRANRGASIVRALHCHQTLLDHSCDLWRDLVWQQIGDPQRTTAALVVEQLQARMVITHLRRIEHRPGDAAARVGDNDAALMHAQTIAEKTTSEERRGGNERGDTGRHRWSEY